MKALELRIPPLALLGLFAAAMFGIAEGLPSAGVELPARRAIAALLAAAGAAIALAGVVAFRTRATTVDPRAPGRSSALVTGGVYRISRNPMYLGFLLALAGWAVWLASAAAAALLPLFVAWLNRFQIGPEERALAQRFGPAFAAYAAAVRRWC